MNHRYHGDLSTQEYEITIYYKYRSSYCVATLLISQSINIYGYLKPPIKPSSLIMGGGGML